MQAQRVINHGTYLLQVCRKNPKDGDSRMRDSSHAVTQAQTAGTYAAPGTKDFSSLLQSICREESLK